MANKAMQPPLVPRAADGERWMEPLKAEVGN
jgi:hypothetical protein